MATRRRTIGIDPGSRKTGFGIIEQVGNRFIWIHSGTIVTGKGAFQERIVRIFDELQIILATYQPTEAAIETIFFAKNANSALKLGHARGVAMLAVAKYGLTLHEYEPNVVKKAVVGYGSAKKEQVKMMISILLNKKTFSGNDETDALAIAICHLNHRAVRIKLTRL